MSTKASRIIPGRYPPPGTSPVADAIRVRRGVRGITPLDAALLHAPPVAGGWNSLLGAIRTQGKLPGDVRELMILRVAALNHAAFEWIHHEHVGRDCGLTTAQLYIIRDTATPLPPAAGILSDLQTSALLFADASTRKIKVGRAITDALQKHLDTLVRQNDPSNVEEQVQDLLVEAAAVVASYNMVSRFLVSLDVAGMSDDTVPWPVERQEHFIPIPSSTGTSHTVHVITLTSSPSAPWIVFANSLLTDLSMWSYLIPYLLSDVPDPHNSKPRLPYNLLFHSQRGHGLSSLPPQPQATSIRDLASDISHLFSQLNIKPPVHALVGVSQGGATALAFAQMFPDLAHSVVACDTAARTPAGNREAWAARIRMVYGDVNDDQTLNEGGDIGKGTDYAVKVGMEKLAEATVPRWFSAPSKCATDESERAERAQWLRKMVENTSVDGFVAGAEALSNYDLLKGAVSAYSLNTTHGNIVYQITEANTLFESSVRRVLLVAGSLDGGGKVGNGLKKLSEEWNAVRCKDEKNYPVEYVEIPGAGHLPMVDETEQFAEILRKFLDELKQHT